MAHSNGRIYIDTSVTPNVGISIADIQQTLGSGRNDIGGLITALRSDGKPLVNRWSKIKPLRGGGVGYLVASGTNYRGSEYPTYNCGFQAAKAFTTLTEFIQNVGNFYSYRLPDPNIGSKFRFLDFNGYNHNAEAPYVETTVPGEQFTKRDFDAGFVINFNQPQGSLTFQDILPDGTNLGDLYPAMVFYQAGNPTSAWIFTSQYNLSRIVSDELAWVVPIPQSRQTVNKWYNLVPALTSSSYYGGAGALASGDALFPVAEDIVQIRIVEAQPNWVEISNFSVVYNATTGRYQVRFNAVLTQMSGDPSNPITYYEVFAGPNSGSTDITVAQAAFDPDSTVAYGTFNINKVSESGLNFGLVATLVVHLANGDTGSDVRTYETVCLVAQE